MKRYVIRIQEVEERRIDTVLQLHEDNDILGRFSPEVYTWTTPGKGLFQIGCFVATVLSLCGVVYLFYPDKPAVPRRFPHNGLEVALGGKGALPVCRLPVEND